MTNDGLDPTTRELVERLAAADAVAASERPAHKRRWYRRVLDSRTAIVVLIAMAAGFLGYSVWVNQQAIQRTDTQAAQAKAQAAAAAKGQLAAVQLICTLERDIRENSTKLTSKERSDLVEYDRELQCGPALLQPHVKITLQPTPGSKPHASAAGGGQGGVHTPPSHPRPSPQSSPVHSSSPSSAPTARPTHRPSPSPTPTCTLHNPLTGQCILHLPPPPVLKQAADFIAMLVVRDVLD